MLKKVKKPQEVRGVLPFDGMSRWSQIKPFSPFSRETFRKMVLAGRAPQPIRMGVRCTFWRNSELHEFFQDPISYEAEKK